MTDSAKAVSDGVGRALAFGLANRHEDAWNEIKALAAKGTLEMFATTAALAEVAVQDRVEDNPGGFFGLTVQHHGQEADINEAPAAQRFAMQLMAAQANRDFDTARALFKAQMRTDPESVADATLILYDVALAAARERIARHKAS
jgi:hypothetical protein